MAKIATFIDNFADLSQWTVETGTPTVAANECNLGSDGTVADVMHSTVQNWDVTDSGIDIQVPFLATAYRESYFGITAPGDSPFGIDAGFFFTGDGSSINVHFEGANVGTGFAFVPSNYFRVRELGGTLFWETTADPNGVWTQQHSVPSPAWIDAVQVMLGIYFVSAAADPVATYANLNTDNPLPPPPVVNAVTLGQGVSVSQRRFNRFTRRIK